jgi:hypothetical protein
LNAGPCGRAFSDNTAASARKHRSHICSPDTRSKESSRSNWAKDRSTFSVNPIEVVVLNCWVTATNEIDLASNASTSIGVALSQQIGGAPALTAALAILGGIIAAVVGQEMLHGLQVRDWRAHGLAAGIAGSGVAAAQVAARNELGAAFAALGIGLNGLLTAILVPRTCKTLALGIVNVASVGPAHARL